MDSIGSQRFPNELAQSQDYNEAIQNPASASPTRARRAARRSSTPSACPCRAPATSPTSTSSRGADGKTWAVKCFTRQVARPARALRRDRRPPAAGQAALHGRTSPTSTRASGSAASGIPLLKMDWVEGFTLNEFVARERRQAGTTCDALMQMWAKLAGRLRDANMAHADLQHGNVLLVPGATAEHAGAEADRLRRHVGAGPGRAHSGEVGHPNYQHPQRLRERTVQRRGRPLPAPGHLHRPARPRWSAAGRCGTSTTTATTCCSRRPTCATRPTRPCSRRSGT